MNATFGTSRLGQVLALVFVLTGSHAFGQSQITQDLSFSGLGGTTTDALSFNSFNSSLGTLTSVEIVLENVTLSGSATGTNNSAPPPLGQTNGPEDLAVNLTGQLTVSASGITNIVVRAEDDTNNAQANIAVGASTQTFLYNDAASSPDSGLKTTTTTGGYLGDGVTTVTVNVTPAAFGVTGLASASAGSTANFIQGSFTGVATGAGDVELIYNYTPAPEPSKTAAIFIGFALCVFVGRKYFQGRDLGLRLA